MDRKEAYDELNNPDLAELLMTDMSRHVPKQFGGNLYDVFRLFANKNVMPEKLMQEIMAAMDLKSTDTFEKLIAAADDGKEQHYVNESYRLAESRKISMVKHNRLSRGAFHDHEFFEIACLFHGSCTHTFRLPGGGEETTVLHDGELVIIPPGLLHKVSTEGSSLMVNILVHRQTFRSAFLAQLPENNMLYHFFAEALLSPGKKSYICVKNGSEHLTDLILDMYIEEKKADSYSARMEEKILQMFFLELLRSNERTMTLSAGISEKDRLLAEILLFIENNYRSISLADTAEQFHFSKVYLNRIFKEKTGKTVLQTIKELRLAEAEKLLKDASLTVAEVGEMVGYQDTSYFIEEYRKQYGRTPGKERAVEQPHVLGGGNSARLRL